MAQLRDLMKLTGASTESRAASFPALRQLKIVRQLEQLERPPEEPVRQVLYTAATALTGTQGNLAIPNSEIALAALGLGQWEGQRLNLLQRLDAFGTSQGIATSTARGYASHVAELLARTLPRLTIGELVPMRATADPNMVSEVDSRIHWLYEGKTLRRYEARRTLRAGIDPLERFSAFLTYPNDPRSDIMTFVRMRNCRDGGLKRQKIGQFEFTILLPRTAPGELVKFEYDIAVSSQVPDRSYLRHLTRMPGRTSTVSIQFDPAFAPTHVNPFEHAGPDFEPPSDVSHPLAIPVTADGYVEHEFEQHLDTRYGFGWSWPDEGGADRRENS